MAQWINERFGIVAETEPRERGVLVLNIADLKDGHNNTNEIKKKLMIGLQLLEHAETRLLIECKGGISRSPTIAAGILAIQQNINLTTSLDQVARKVPRTQYNYDLVDSLKKTLKSMPQYRHLVDTP